MKRIFLLITLLSLIAQGISAQNGNVSVTGRVESDRLRKEKQTEED